MFGLVRLYFYYVKSHLWAWWHGYEFHLDMEDEKGQPVEQHKGFYPFLDRRKEDA